MIAFEVKDMTCGHCVSTITKAVRAADKDAKVQIDLATQRVLIEPAEADAAELSDAIKEAGYTPVPIAVAATPPVGGESSKSSGCCGGRRKTASAGAGESAVATGSCCS